LVEVFFRDNNGIVFFPIDHKIERVTVAREQAY
jgi:hypothetical protein